MGGADAESGPFGDLGDPEIVVVVVEAPQDRHGPLDGLGAGAAGFLRVVDGVGDLGRHAGSLPDSIQYPWTAPRRRLSSDLRTVGAMSSPGAVHVPSWRDRPAGLRTISLGRRGPLAPGGPYAVVDVETTGLDPTVDRVVEVAVVRCDEQGHPVSEWSTLVQPDRDPGPTTVHGLTADDLAAAPRFTDVALRAAPTGRRVGRDGAQPRLRRRVPLGRVPAGGPPGPERPRAVHPHPGPSAVPEARGLLPGHLHRGGRHRTARGPPRPRRRPGHRASCSTGCSTASPPAGGGGCVDGCVSTDPDHLLDQRTSIDVAPPCDHRPRDRDHPGATHRSIAS